MLTYHDIEAALRRVPVERLPRVYEFIITQAEWPYDASPAEMEADDREWQQRFVTEESQRLFERMAAEVRAEVAAGTTEPLEILLAEDEAGDEIKDNAPV